MPWTRTAAGDAGWELKDHPDGYHIERVMVDVPGGIHQYIFETDLEAAGYVLMCAVEQDPRALDAINLMLPFPEPELDCSNIERITRVSIKTIHIEFEDTRDASQFEVELCAMKDRQG